MQLDHKPNLTNATAQADRIIIAPGMDARAAGLSSSRYPSTSKTKLSTIAIAAPMKASNSPPEYART